ncbi:MAG: choline-sulfatase [Parasphingorhabdus sp.]|jgi:choline-sulfatase
MPHSKPNILIIQADQLAPQFLASYGHPLVKAPAIDRLAEEGVVFESAYTNSPLCAPSRFVMMSGRLPSKIAAWDNAVEFSSEVPTFSHYLSAEGYKTCLSGKMHFVGPDQLHGFEDRLTTDVYPADYTWHPEWDNPGKRLDWYHNMDPVAKAGVCTRSMYMDYDDEAVFKAKRYLFDHARSGAEQPFMLTVSMIQPHDPYLCSQKHWDLYRDDEIDLPRVPLGSVEEDPHSGRLRFGYGATDVNLSDEQIANARHAYYGSVSAIDEKVSELVETLELAGLADNTVIIFTADHGDMLGEKGMWFKMSFLEHSSRVPLIIHAPKMFSPKRIKEAVSLMDLLPTVVDLSRDGQSVDYATPLEGRSLLPHMSGGSGHDEAIGEYFAEGTDVPIFMIAKNRRKMIYSSSDPLQYFDLENDPMEIQNLATDPTYQQEIDTLRSELPSKAEQSVMVDKVLESQRRRNFIKHVMKDQNVSWDHQPIEDAENSYIRNNQPIYQLEKKARFPVA